MNDLKRKTGNEGKDNKLVKDKLLVDVVVVDKNTFFV